MRWAKIEWTTSFFGCESAPTNGFLTRPIGGSAGPGFAPDNPVLNATISDNVPETLQ